MLYIPDFLPFSTLTCGGPLLYQKQDEKICEAPTMHDLFVHLPRVARGGGKVKRIFETANEINRSERGALRSRGEKREKRERFRTRTRTRRNENKPKYLRAEMSGYRI